jgi:hypothetical protein
MKRKFIAGLVFVCLILGVFAGCGNASETVAETVGTTSMTTTSAVTTTTEATTVYSTKDGINLENAPEMRPEMLNKVFEGPVYDKAIDGIDYLVRPWNGAYHPTADFSDTAGVKVFDKIDITLVKDGIWLAGAEYSGIVDGIEYTPDQKWEFITVIEQKYPNYKFPYLEKIDDEPTFALTIDGQEELRVNIYNPIDGDAAGDLDIDIKSMKNSILYCGYRRIYLEVSGTVENSNIYYGTGAAELTNLDFGNFNGCRINVVIGTPKDGYISNLFSNSRIYNLHFNGGTDNYIDIIIRNMNDDDGAVNITTGGMVASRFDILSSNSSINYFEDVDNPNFNSVINFEIPDVIDFDNSDLNWTFQTNDLDNTPLYLKVPIGELERYAEIQTGGQVYKLPISFPGNAPTDGSVFKFGE